jgi:hypothetical protein
MAYKSVFNLKLQSAIGQNCRVFCWQIRRAGKQGKIAEYRFIGGLKWQSVFVNGAERSIQTQEPWQ